MTRRTDWWLIAATTLYCVHPPLWVLLLLASGR